MRSAKHFTCTRSATLITNVYVLSYSVLMRGRYWVFMGVKVAELSAGDGSPKSPVFRIV